MFVRQVDPEAEFEAKSVLLMINVFNRPDKKMQRTRARETRDRESTGDKALTTGITTTNRQGQREAQRLIYTHREGRGD